MQDKCGSKSLERRAGAATAATTAIRAGAGAATAARKTQVARDALIPCKA